MSSLGMQTDHVEEQKTRRKTGGHTRDRRGCLTCRKRKKKCDLNNINGSCKACIGLNRRCEWEPLRSLSPLPIRSSKPAVSIVIAPNPKQFWIEAGSENDSNGPRIHAYYMSFFANTLTTNVENNGFLNVLLPLSLSDDTRLLAKIISAWSASHLALVEESEDAMIKAKGLRNKMLEALTRSIAMEEERALCHIAACLVFTSMLSILGEASEWPTHLRFAAALIKATMKGNGPHDQWESSLGGFFGRWLLRNFAYHDILASVSLSQDMLLPELSLYEAGEGGLADTYVGIADLPMAMLAKICIQAGHLRRTSCCFEIEAESSSAVTLWKVSRELDETESRLRSWQPPDTPDPSLASLAETYRSAALIYLYRVRRDHMFGPGNTLQQDIQREVESVLLHVKAMIPKCLPECTLLFPLFLAGGELHDHQQQEFVRKRMEDLVDYRKFLNVHTALQVLQGVWDKRTTWPMTSYDWTDFLQEKGWKLSLS